MDLRAKRVLTIAGVAFAIITIGFVLFYILTPKLPSTQLSDKTVVIDNYRDYTKYISSDSLGILGNYLYNFINKPTKGVYHARIIDESYSYSSESWFSKFVVQLEDSDTAGNISMQTIKGGEIPGDISVTCKAGGDSCLKKSPVSNPDPSLQAFLPITSNDYIISYQTKNIDILSIVYYDQQGTGKEKALEKIKSLGFKPEDYKIEYFYGGR